MLAIPFHGKAISTPYANPIGIFAYLGLEKSGLMCNMPMGLNNYADKPMSSASYDCPVEVFQFEYPGWNNKWYNPLCRPWYKEQKVKFNQNTMGDLYRFSSANILGISPCAPVFKRVSKTDQNDSSNFFGALCMDIDSAGPLNKYFPED